MDRGHLPNTWQLTITDFLGRTIRTERPGIESGTGVPPVISTTHTYNALGRQTLTAQDVNFNGEIDLDGPDRVSSNATQFVKINGDWYRESRSCTFPEENSDTAILTGTQRRAHRFHKRLILVALATLLAPVSSQEHGQSISHL